MDLCKAYEALTKLEEELELRQDVNVSAQAERGNKRRSKDYNDSITHTQRSNASMESF
jgi:hypothetical protein